ncbi:MAG: VOC family protein [Patescibacteria group bacterium]
MQKIISHLWYDKEAKEAAEFYVSLFPKSKITNISNLNDTPSGDVDIVSFELWEQPFMAISAGPYFKFNPSISFMVNFDPAQNESASQKIDEIWEKLSDEGEIRMPIGKYPFSERYGWVADKYGLNWQLILTNPNGESRPPIIPSLLFVGDKAGLADEARKFYLSVFKDSEPGALFHYGKDQEPNKEGTVMFSDFRLFNTWFVAMDGGGEHNFDFNESISFIVSCKNQEEIDYYWNKLSAVPEAEQCGWLKDKYGVSWQITPKEMDEMMNKGTPDQINRVTQAFLKMKKFDIEKLKEAYEGQVSI